MALKALGSFAARHGPAAAAAFAALGVGRRCCGGGGADEALNGIRRWLARCDGGYALPQASAEFPSTFLRSSDPGHGAPSWQLMRLAPPTAVSLRALLLTPALTCRRSMASTAAIEVERKFAASDPSALRQRVEANGGLVLGEKAFNDQYWDNAQCTLTRRDTWLRRRQDQWELKVPIVGSRRSGGETTSFREIEGEPRQCPNP